MIMPPVLPADHPDRLLTCEEALEPMFLDMMACALKVGWTDNEAVAAINSLADHYLLSRQANAETDAAIRHENGR